MRLAAESYGCEAAEMPEMLRAVALEDADLHLPAEEQRDKALNLVFDETYRSYKDLVSENVSMSVEILMDEMRTQQKESLEQLLRQIRQEVLLVIVMLLISSTARSRLRVTFISSKNFSTCSVSPVAIKVRASAVRKSDAACIFAAACWAVKLSSTASVMRV